MVLSQGGARGRGGRHGLAQSLLLLDVLTLQIKISQVLSLRVLYLPEMPPLPPGTILDLRGSPPSQLSETDQYHPTVHNYCYLCYWTSTQKNIRIGNMYVSGPVFARKQNPHQEILRKKMFS